MKRLFFTSVGAALAMLLLAGPALGTTPIPIVVSMSSIQLAGHAGEVVDPRAELRMQFVNSTDQNPYVNGTVQIQFASCAGNDLHLAETQPFPGILGWDCASRTATTLSDVHGVATFRFLGNASAVPGNSPGLTTGCAIVRIDGLVVSAPLRVAAYDLDGKNGVNGADQSLLLATLFAGPPGYRSRADYNGDGVVNSADLAKFLTVQFGGGSVASAGTLCF